MYLFDNNMNTYIFLYLYCEAIAISEASLNILEGVPNMSTIEESILVSMN